MSIFAAGTATLRVWVLGSVFAFCSHAYPASAAIVYVTASDKSVAASADSSVGVVDAGLFDEFIHVSDLTHPNNFASSSSSFSGNESAAHTSWTFYFGQFRSGEKFGYGGVTLHNLDFTVTQNTSYSLTGVYDLQGTGQFSAGVWLKDMTTNQFLFYDVNYSNHTLNESFALGATSDGDYYNDTSGSLTGNLVIGHDYRLFFDYFTQALPTADDGATASGHLQITFGENLSTESVPEPASLAIWSALGVLIAARRRRFDS